MDDRVDYTGLLPDGLDPRMAKPSRTMSTLGLVIVGFFWTSGGFYGK